jgi:UDP-N-acetyl-D-glucosamine dehydrogenase
VLVAGVAYKRDIDDMRESPAMDVMGLLLARGAKVSYADPYVPVVHGREWSGGYDIKAVDMTRGQIAQYDCVVIVTDHKAFDYAALVEEADVIVDTRNAIKTQHPHVFKLGSPQAAHEPKPALA